MPKRKRQRHTGAPDVTSEPREPPAITRPRRTTRRPAKKEKEEAWDHPDTPLDADGHETPLTDIDEQPSPKKSKGKGTGKGRKKKSDEPVVYDIPPVEHKTTDFKGRLGYACLNTVLRALKPESIFCSRTCRKDTIHKNGLEFAQDLALKNVRDLQKMIEWNEENNIRFMRISSEMFPFASHGELGYDLEFAKDELKAAGDLAKKLGHRLTAHPGQFTQLASPKDAVIEASIRELEYHCQMMRYMGLSQDSVIILHMGGVYNDKPATLERFKHTYTTRLTDEMRARLVLENDEICYSVDDLLPVCQELGVPIVLDYHHNWINPSTIPLQALIPMINITWHAKGVKPKQHLSSPKPQFADGSGSVMDRRAHADRCYELPAEVGWKFDKEEDRDVDLMIEAKDKEQAVFHLYRIYNLQSVKHENLRPEKPQLPCMVGSAEADEDGLPEGQTALDREADTTDTKRPRKQKKQGKNAEVNDETARDPSADSVVQSPKKRRRKAKAQGQDASPEANTDTAAEGDDANTSMLQSQDLTSLLNQEDVPLPVDGAPLSLVEAEEHPEAMAAARVDGEGCGIVSKGGAKTVEKPRIRKKKQT